MSSDELREALSQLHTVKAQMVAVKSIVAEQEADVAAYKTVWERILLFNPEEFRDHLERMEADLFEVQASLQLGQESERDAQGLIGKAARALVDGVVAVTLDEHSAVQTSATEFVAVIGQARARLQEAGAYLDHAASQSLAARMRILKLRVV